MADHTQDLDISKLDFASRAVHADDHISVHRAVAPALHVSTTFRYRDDPDALDPKDITDPAAPLDSHVYSRLTNPNTSRLEAVLSSLLSGEAVTYSSGLAAFHALVVHVNPRRVLITGGYHGCHAILQIIKRLNGLEILPLEYTGEIQPTDLIHVETPINPTGEAIDISHHAKRAHSAGAILSVDATFAPPPLQNPFALGADIVMHSGTKYFGGHSDLLCGVLATNPKHGDWAAKLRTDRIYLGAVPGNMESWLALRSLRTLSLRIERQSKSATQLVQWLAQRVQSGDASDPIAALVDKVLHASLQPEASDSSSWLAKQMPRGYGPVFTLVLKDEDDARRLPSTLRLFHHATSLGGVESLVEWRAMSDPTVERTVLRFSIGVEGWEDLRDDLEAGFGTLARLAK